MEFKLTKEEVLEFRNIVVGLLGNYSLSRLIKLFETKGEYPIDVYKTSSYFYFANPVIKYALHLLLVLTGNGRLSEYSQYGRPLSKEVLDDLVRLRDNWQEKMRLKFEALRISAVIAPINVSCAYTHA